MWGIAFPILFCSLLCLFNVWEIIIIMMIKSKTNATCLYLLTGALFPPHPPRLGQGRGPLLRLLQQTQIFPVRKIMWIKDWQNCVWNEWQHIINNLYSALHVYLFFLFYIEHVKTIMPDFLSHWAFEAFTQYHVHENPCRSQRRVPLPLLWACWHKFQSGDLRSPSRFSLCSWASSCDLRILSFRPSWKKCSFTIFLRK